MTAGPPDSRAAVLYSREDCSLCFALKRQAQRSARRHRMRLIVLDVDSDPGLQSRYGDRVPVLLLSGGASIAGRAEARVVDEAFRESVRLSPDSMPGDRRDSACGRDRRGGLAWIRRVLGRDPKTTPG